MQIETEGTQLMREALELFTSSLAGLDLGDERARCDRLAAVFKARVEATIDLYEDVDYEHRRAVAAMYAAGAIGLELLELLDRRGTAALRSKRLVEDLIADLYTYVIPLHGEPELEIG